MKDTNSFYCRYLKISAAIGASIVRAFFAVFLLSALCGCTAAVQKSSTTAEVPSVQEPPVRVDELAQAKEILEQNLKKEILDNAVGLRMTEKGLVVTFGSDMLFDADKSKLRPDAYGALEKVSRVLREDVGDLKIAVEAYTDNEPSQALGWRSNWELSAARALSVVHYLQDETGIAGWRLCAAGYGEYRPVADNATREGRQANRRIEMVIMPRTPTAAGAGLIEPTALQE